MTPQDLTARLIAALALPAQALVNQRIAKKLLMDNGASTAADKRLIQDGIEDLFWVAALKPETVGVPAYRDDTREYLELAVLTVSLRAAAAPRLAELVHRAIPYPVLLVVADAANIAVSLAHIRWAQREAGRSVLDGASVQARVPGNETGQAFAQALALPNQPRTHLLDLYQGWMDTATALQAAELTGRFIPSASRESAAARRAALHQCRELDAEMLSLRKAASNEKQIARQVAINLDIKTLVAERQKAAAKLQN